MSSALNMDQEASLSMLEEMLDSLKKRDDHKSKDVMPALPSRPSLKGRLPSTRKSMPLNFKIGSTKETVLKDSERFDGNDASAMNIDQEYLASKGGTFGRKRAVKADQLVESPYTESSDDADAASYASGTGVEKLGCRDTMNYVLEKDSCKGYSDKQDADMAELQRRVQKVEAILSQKEVENATLQQQIQQYEKRWSEYEDKMMLKEEMWQKEVTALQRSLGVAKKHLPDSLPTLQDYDSESTISTASRTPQSTPLKQHHASDAGVARDIDGNWNAAGDLVKEFEQRIQAFEDDARSIVELKSGESGSNLNNLEELRKLKVRYAAWKKDFRARLREAKAAAQKHGLSEGEKRRINWWRKGCLK